MHLTQSGLLNKWKKYFWSKDECFIKKQEEMHRARPVTLYDITGIFIVLAFGIMTSFFVFILEYTRSIGQILKLIRVYLKKIH